MSENRNRLLLSAAILNSEREIEIYDWLGRTCLEYHGQFNKRFETWLNKQASERFGTKVISDWGGHGIDKEFPKVNFYMHKDEYPLTDVVKYEFSFNYDGKDVACNYETREWYIRDKSENEKLFGVSGTSDLAQNCIRIIANRRENVGKMQNNLANIDAIEKRHAELTEMLERYNNSLSWPLSETLRIKAR